MTHSCGCKMVLCYSWQRQPSIAVRVYGGMCDRDAVVNIGQDRSLLVFVCSFNVHMCVQYQLCFAFSTHQRKCGWVIRNRDGHIARYIQCLSEITSTLFSFIFYLSIRPLIGFQALFVISESCATDWIRDTMFLLGNNYFSINFNKIFVIRINFAIFLRIYFKNLQTSLNSFIFLLNFTWNHIGFPWFFARWRARDVRLWYNMLHAYFLNS